MPLDPRLNARPSQAFAPTYLPTPTFGLDNFSRLAPLGPTLPAAAQPTLDQLEGPPTGGSLPTTMEPALPMLLAGGATGVYLQSGSRGPDVQLVQRQLLTAGFNPGAVDGVMGPQTVQALRQFQASRGLATDGVVGARTWLSLRRSMAMRLWFAQMLLNFAWSPVFFGLRDPTSAMIIILGLLVSVAGFIAVSWRQDRTAALLFLPYLAWVAFASALNGAILALN